MSVKSNTLSYPGKDLESMDFALNYHAWILDMFRPYMGKSLLEPGAGRGSFSEFILKHTKVELWPMEPSDEMYPLLQEKAQALDIPTHQVLKGFLSEHVAHLRGKIDTVAYVNVMEHVQDDQAEMSMVFDLLPTKGHLLTFSPAMPWLMSNFDRKIGHYRRYTKTDMLDKMQTAGFEIVSAKYVDMPGIIPWYLFFTLMGKDLGGGSTKLYDQAVIPWLRHLESIVPVPIGKNLLVIGRKP